MLTLDQYIHDSGIARVDFMKMDIEGYELFAMEGARDAIREGKLPTVFFELKGPLVAVRKITARGHRAFPGVARITRANQDFDVVTTPRDVEICGPAWRRLRLPENPGRPAGASRNVLHARV
jgi:hypothetical protein